MRVGVWATTSRRQTSAIPPFAVPPSHGALSPHAHSSLPCGLRRSGSPCGAVFAYDARGQRQAQSLHDRRGVGQAPQRPHVGLHQRGRHRQGWQARLGRRTVQCEQLRRLPTGAGAQVRPDRQARGQLRCRHDPVATRHSRGPRRQHLGGGLRVHARCHAGTRRQGASDPQVQPHRHASALARRTRRRSRLGVLLAAQRHRHGEQRRHLRGRGAFVAHRLERARARVRQARRAQEVLGHVGQGCRATRSAACPRVRQQGPPLHRRPRQ